MFPPFFAVSDEGKKEISVYIRESAYGILLLARPVTASNILWRAKTSEAKNVRFPRSTDLTYIASYSTHSKDRSPYGRESMRLSAAQKLPEIIEKRIHHRDGQQGQKQA